MKKEIDILNTSEDRKDSDSFIASEFMGVDCDRIVDVLDTTIRLVNKLYISKDSLRPLGECSICYGHGKHKKNCPINDLLNLYIRLRGKDAIVNKYLFNEKKEKWIIRKN